MPVKDGMMPSECRNIVTADQSYYTQQGYSSKKEKQSFSGKQILREFINTRPDLQKILKGDLTSRSETKINRILETCISLNTNRRPDTQKSSRK